MLSFYILFIIQDKSPTKPEVRSSPTKPELRSPVSKKPRLFEKVAVKEIKEKKEFSEDEAPIVKRPGRRGMDIYIYL